MADATVKRLGIMDRLIIPNLLPAQGGLVTQRVSKDIRKKVQLTQAEMKAVNMRDVRGRDGQMVVQWDREKTEMVDGVETKVPIEEPVIEVAFTEAELKVLSEAVEKLDKAQKITPENLETCEKFLAIQPERDEQEPAE